MPSFFPLIPLLFIILRPAASFSTKISNKMAKKRGGIMSILSPAKTLDLSPTDGRLSHQWTVPDCNSDKTRQIAELMKSRSQGELKTLLGISANLAKTANEVRYHPALSCGSD
jgi:hypothetical protein